MALLNYLDSLVGSLGLGEKEMNEGVHEQKFFCMIWVIWQLQNGSSRELWSSIFPSVQDPSWGGSPLGKLSKTPRGCGSSNSRLRATNSLKLAVTVKPPFIFWDQNKDPLKWGKNQVNTPLKINDLCLF